MESSGQKRARKNTWGNGWSSVKNKDKLPNTTDEAGNYIDRAAYHEEKGFRQFGLPGAFAFNWENRYADLLWSFVRPVLPVL